MLLVGTPAFAQPSERVRIEFHVEVPASTPAADFVFVTGNVPELGPWDPGRLALTRAGKLSFVTDLDLPRGLRFEYKITRGSWETVEKGPGGEEIANRTFVVAGPETVRVQVAKWRDQVESVVKRASTATGDVRHFGRIASRHLGNERDVWVYLPASYGREFERRYPVIYFHDGQNMFDAATAFIGIEWGADETLARLAAAGEMREAIAVAVANTPRRMQEYTQTDDTLHGRGGDADAYLQFLAQELKPRIDAEFRTLREREHTAIVGSSLGGLVSLYSGVAAWETWGLVGGVSPVFAWGDHDLESRYQAAPAEHLPLRLWIDMGTAEVADDIGPDSRLVRELRRFRDVAVARGYVLGHTLGYAEVTGAPHNEAAWAARLPDILRFLLPPGGTSPAR